MAHFITIPRNNFILWIVYETARWNHALRDGVSFRKPSLQTRFHSANQVQTDVTPLEIVRWNSSLRLPSGIVKWATGVGYHGAQIGNPVASWDLGSTTGASRRAPWSLQTSGHWLPYDSRCSMTDSHIGVALSSHKYLMRLSLSHTSRQQTCTSSFWFRDITRDDVVCVWKWLHYRRRKIYWVSQAKPYSK